MKVCVWCQRRLSEEDLLVRECRRMEAARESTGLEGVRFRYFSCPRCGHDHVFLEVIQLPGESRRDFDDRKEALTRAAQETHGLRTTVLVVEQNGQDG